MEYLRIQISSKYMPDEPIRSALVALFTDPSESQRIQDELDRGHGGVTTRELPGHNIVEFSVGADPDWHPR